MIGKYFKVNSNLVLLLLITAFTPLAYAIKSPLIIIMLLLSIILILLDKNMVFNEKCFVIYILLFSYFGVGFSFIKFYDLFMILFLLIRIIRQDKIVSLRISIMSIMFLVVIILSFINQSNLNISTGIEIFRYFLCIATVFSFSNLTIDYDNIRKPLFIIALGLIVQGIEVCILFLKYNIQPVTSPFLTVEFYNDFHETRVSGFFSDPNKYFLFFLFLIIIMYQLDDKHKDSILLNFIGAISSLSRTVFLSIASYGITYVIEFSEHKKWKVYLKLLLIIFLSFLGYLLFKDTIIPLINDVFLKMLELLGRDRTAEINSNIQEDNRVQIWKTVINYLPLRPILGNGPLSYSSFGMQHPTHNTYLNLILDYGFAGVVTYFSLISDLFKKIPVRFVVSFILIPMFFLDLGNFRLIFLLIGILNTKGENEDERSYSYN